MLLLIATALAQANVAGYFRVMTRPDFVGGDGKLGYWNLYGRLLNEGPYGALELRLDLLERQPARREPWSALHIKVEGGSVAAADSNNGSLALFRLSQVYVLAGNILLPNVNWRLGSLESTFGDLGLYDMKPASILTDTLGLSGTIPSEYLDVTVGFGDAGYSMKGSRYNTVFSGGGTARLKLGKFELGGGGQFWYEPSVPGNRNAPYATPGVGYEEYVRGEFLQNYAEENPGAPQDIPDPVAQSSLSYAGVGYMGFGGFGPFRWNNLFVRYQKLHPDTWYTESFNGEDVNIYLHDLTDERTYLMVGDELQLGLIPQRLDLVAGGVFMVWNDGDNEIAPSDYDRTCMSGVGRLQFYLKPALHLLAESSYAVEKSHNGNAFREHTNSIFEGENGAADERGLEYGDADTRTTFQIKGGVVMNPLGPGIYTRPSLRLLYGGQWSSQNNAFGNSFVETLDQYNTFGNVERHWHHVLALETEVWF